MVEGESNQLNTNKWPRGMNQTSTKLSENFSKLPPLCGGSVGPPNGLIGAPCLSPYEQLNCENWPKCMKLTSINRLEGISNMHYWVQWLWMTNRTSYKSYSMVQSGKNEPNTEETVKQSKVKQNFRNKPIWWHWPVRLTPITVAATLYFLIVFL